MVRPHVDEALVAPHVVDAVGIRARHIGTREIVALHAEGLLRRAPLLAGVRVVADQFLLLGVDRQDRQPGRQGPLDAGVDMAKLGIPVGMIRPLLGLARALKTVVLVVEELGDLHVTDRMTLAAQLRRQGPRAFADPAQRGFRIAPRVGFNQAVQRDQQLRIVNRHRLAPRSSTTDPTGLQPRPAPDLADALRNGPSRQSARAVHEGHASVGQSQRLTRRHQAARPFIQHRPHRSELLPQPPHVRLHALPSYRYVGSG